MPNVPCSLLFRFLPVKCKACPDMHPGSTQVALLTAKISEAIDKGDFLMDASKNMIANLREDVIAVFGEQAAAVVTSVMTQLGDIIKVEKLDASRAPVMDTTAILRTMLVQLEPGSPDYTQCRTALEAAEAADAQQRGDPSLN